jgi:hypothetical protein
MEKVYLNQDCIIIVSDDDGVVLLAMDYVHSDNQSTAEVKEDSYLVQTEDDVVDLSKFLDGLPYIEDYGIEVKETTFELSFKTRHGMSVSCESSIKRNISRKDLEGMLDGYEFILATCSLGMGDKIDTEAKIELLKDILS